MTIAELQPDVALAALLNEKVEVQTSATSKYAIKAYEQAKMPNKGLADEFLTVGINGVITEDAVFRGNLALTIYCKANADNTAKTARIAQMKKQCKALFNRKSSQGFFFWINAKNVITPTYVNTNNGYATTTINIKWKERR